MEKLAEKRDLECFVGGVGAARDAGKFEKELEGDTAAEEGAFMTGKDIVKDDF